MTDADRRRVVEIRGYHAPNALRPSASNSTIHVKELLAIIERMRTVTREDVERVARAMASVLEPGLESTGWDLYAGAARAALRAMGKEVVE